MHLLLVVLISALCLGAAYFLYGGMLSRLLKLDADAVTPAVFMRDDIDYAPIEPKFLMSQHFSAIAAAGPIVGPILAGVMFGWLPALLWILVGSIFIGGVHDITSLVASVRHKARSIAEVVRVHMSRRSYVLFLLFKVNWWTVLLSYAWLLGFFLWREEAMRLAWVLPVGMLIRMVMSLRGTAKRRQSNLSE